MQREPPDCRGSTCPAEPLHPCQSRIDRNQTFTPGGRLDLLVDPSSNLSTKYTFLYLGLHLIPRTSLHASTVFRSRSTALLGHCWTVFYCSFRNSWMPAKGLSVEGYRRNPQSGRGVQTQPRRLPTSVPTAPQCSSFIRSGSATPGGPLRRKCEGTTVACIPPDLCCRFSQFFILARGTVPV
jgi:hypothetical protein